MNLRTIAQSTIGRAADARTTSQRDELRREQRVRIAMRSKWAEFPRDDLEFHRFHVEHRPTGTRYRVVQGEIDAQFCPAVAYYIDRRGGAVFLEPT